MSGGITRMSITGWAEQVTARYEPSGLRYQDIGHHAGCVIWWMDNAGKMKRHVSTGIETHHALVPRLNMDRRWRGRYDPEALRVPAWLVRRLRRMGAVRILMDTTRGLRQLRVG